MSSTGCYGSNSAAASLSKKLADACAQAIPSLLCPSDGTSGSVWSFDAGLGMMYLSGTNYMGSTGDAVKGQSGLPWAIDGAANFFGNNNPKGSTITSEAFNELEVKTTAFAARGLFMPGNFKSFGAITDGTSNTAAFSEACQMDHQASFDASSFTAEGRSIKVKGGIAFTDALSSDPTSETNHPFNPYGGCLAIAADPSDRTIIRHEYNGRCFRGLIAFDGHAGNTKFNTILPPNSPSCSFQGSYGLNTEGRWGVFSASSNHPGGVNVSMADGSVRFVSDSIDCTTNDGTDITGSHYARTTGSSLYGVWGAMGTPAGGESKSL